MPTCKRFGISEPRLIASPVYRSLVATCDRWQRRSPRRLAPVRRRLGAWYRGVLRDRFGPIAPPVADLPSVLQQLADTGRDLGPQAERELERIVLELVEVNIGGAPVARSDIADG